MKKRRTKTPLQKAKDRVWELCRAITFHRHGTQCYTCGAKGLAGGNLQCGHFIPSSVCSAFMRYHLDNLRPQCMACNIHKSGNWIEYEKRLNQDFGEQYTTTLKRLNEATKGEKYDITFYENTISELEEILSTIERPTL